MIELLGYLGAHEFTCYIISGGGRDFMRRLLDWERARTSAADFTQSAPAIRIPATNGDNSHPHISSRLPTPPCRWAQMEPPRRFSRRYQ